MILLILFLSCNYHYDAMLPQKFNLHEKKISFYHLNTIFFVFLHVRKGIDMKRLTSIFTVIGIMVALMGCGSHQETDNGQDAHDPIPLMTTQIQQCSRLYTAEYRIHKIIACESNRQIEGFGLSFGTDVFGDRKIVIPMNATIKGYIDLSQITEEDIERRADKLIITLPDPQVMMTSTTIDHENVKQYVTGFRNLFTDQEMATFEAQGRQAIINDIPSMGIEKTARENAARLLIPIITQLGFDEQDITITFRHDFTPHDLIRLIE